jgi:hypothetical protein
MLPGDMPGRGAPGRGAPGPGRGPWGRGMGRSTGCAEENGLLPTRGVRAAGLGAPGAGPGLGPGVAPGVAPGVGAAGRAGVGAGAAGGAAAAAAGGAAGAAGSAGATGAAGLGAAGFAGAAFVAALAGEPLPSVLTFSAAGFAPPNDSRRRRATGASTVEDADLTNSPCSLSRARTSLLVTPSSLANSCTRALPATTSPSLEASAVVGAAPRVSYDAWSSGLHGVLMFFATCSLNRVVGCSDFSKCSTTAVVSGEPVIRSARANARRRIAASRHAGSGCSQAPRPGRFLAGSTVTAYPPFPSTATTRSSSTASSRFRQPTHVRTGPPGRRCALAEVSRWITAESTVCLLENDKR